MKNIKIRCSKLGLIMTSSRGSFLTEKQKIVLKGLIEKIKLTEAQAKKRDTLIKKRDAKPQLSEGAKTYIKELVIEDKYGYVKEFNSRYCDKGNEVEDEAILLSSDVLDLGFLFKNEKYYDNDFLKGTPDVVTDYFILDVKSSWDATTFPFFDESLKNELYYWQLVGYMILTGKSKSILAYCLVNTPDSIVNDEIRRESWKRFEVDISEQTEQDVLSQHNFDKIPRDKRVKAFYINLDPKHEQQVKERVQLANEYYNEIYDLI